MAYFLKPNCRCCPLECGSLPVRCTPCGRFTHPKKTQEYDHIQKLKKKPMLDFVEDYKDMELHHYVENHAHTRKIIDNAKFQTKLWQAEDKINLNARRDKLRLLLDDENEQYRREIIEKHESSHSNRIDDMRTRVAELKEKRELRHKEFVDKKLNQVFQNQCEEMRSLLTKRMTREIAVDRVEQLREKRRLECEAEDEQRLWDYLWNKDYEQKWKREQAYQCTRDAANKRALEELDKQRELKEKQKADVAKILAKEAELIDADIAALLAERKRYAHEKAERFEKARAHVKDMLETRDYYRNRRVKREEIVAREFLKRAVRELYVEQEDRAQKKRELMNSIQVYRDYLQKRDCLENAKEVAFQRIIDKVIEEQHEKVMASRKREHEQRKQLYENVMAGRALQMEDLKKVKEQDEIDRAKEAATLKEDWERYLRDLAEEKCERQEVRSQYRRDLDCQVLYNEKLKCRELTEKKREDELCDIEERLFKNKLRITLQEANLANSNPYRQPLVGKCIKQCLIPSYSTHPC